MTGPARDALTPTRAASYALFAAGILAAIGAAFVQDWRVWLGAGLALIGASMLVDALLPGGSRLTDQQRTLVRSAGIGDAERAQKAISLVIGGPLLLVGAWLALG